MKFILVLDRAMPPPAPLSPRHAALLLLAHKSALRRPALPGAPTAALLGAFNYRI